MKVFEQEIEQWVADHVDDIWGEGARLVARQLQTGSGVLDLLVVDGTTILVVELKRDVIDSDAITQVCRYLNDLEPLVPALHERFALDDHRLVGCLIAPTVSSDAAEIIAAQRQLQAIPVFPEVSFKVSGFEDLASVADRLSRENIVSHDQYDDLVGRIGERIMERPASDTVSGPVPISVG